MIDDGSNDNSLEVISSFDDTRIHVLTQNNKGVSSARNLGLKHMKGDYFCFLDADDYLPKNSLEDRLKIFVQNDDVRFVDGKVNIFIGKDSVIDQYTPTYNGQPFYELLSISNSCFFGPTWMIKAVEGENYSFEERLTHGEDLYFYITISRSGGMYANTDSVIYNYRKDNISAMNDLRSLEEGYKMMHRLLKSWDSLQEHELKTFKKKSRSIMFKSYLSKGMILPALKSVLY